MVVGDGRKYLTCLITLKVMVMVMVMAKAMVMVTIRSRLIPRHWPQQTNLTQELSPGFKVLAVG